MTWGTLPVTIWSQAPSQWPYDPRHPPSDNMIPGTLPIIWSPEGCLGWYSQSHPSKVTRWNGWWKLTGELGLYGPRHTPRWLRGCLRSYSHWEGASDHMVTGRVPGIIWSLGGCLRSCGHWEGQSHPSKVTRWNGWWRLTGELGTSRPSQHHHRTMRTAMAAGGECPND